MYHLSNSVIPPPLEEVNYLRALESISPQYFGEMSNSSIIEGKINFSQVTSLDKCNDSVEYLSHVGSAIDFFIDKFSMPRKHIAEITGLSLSYLSQIISNKKEPTLKTLIKITVALHNIPLQIILVKAKQLAREKQVIQNLILQKRDDEKDIDEMYSELETLYIKLTNKLENVSS